MRRDRLRAAVVVVLGVLAISAAAATMQGSSGVSIGQGQAADTSGGSGQGRGQGMGSGRRSGMESENPYPNLTLPSSWLTWGLRFVFGGGLLFLVAYVGYQYYRDGWEGIRHILRQSRDVLLGAGLVLALGLFYLLILSLSGGGAHGAPLMQPSPGGTGTSSTEVATNATGGVPPVALAALALVAVIVLMLAVRALLSGSSTGSEVVEAVEADEEEPDVARAEPDPVTGHSFTDVDAENAVYRAWRRLTELVGADRETTTPGEVAREAEREGLDRSAVRTVTDAFEEVRYGHRDPDGDREARATSALDRLDSGGGEA